MPHLHRLPGPRAAGSALRRLQHGWHHRWRDRGERGDVPGWVLVTVMTVAIGMALWGVAQPQLVSILQSALNSVR